MANKFKMLLILILLSQQAFALTELSDKAKLSILTCESGPALYEAFGHSTFRIKDPKLGIDKIYNYGVFDFNAPNFYVKFCQGKMDYMLGTSATSRYFRMYKYHNQGIREQILNLGHDDVKKVYAYLENNAKDENKFYRYDFFFDNCATKLKVVLEEAIPDKKFIFPQENNELTFRDLIDSQLAYNSWGDFGIDIALGSVIDTLALPENYAFLPLHLEATIAQASIIDNNQPQALVASSKTLLPYNQFERKDAFFKPIHLTLIILIITCLVFYFEAKKEKYFAWYDRIFFSIIGLVGLLVTVLWFGTEHTATYWNYNILWANPTHLLVIPILTNKKFARIVRLHFIFWGLVAVAVLAFGWLMPQNFHIAFYPLILAIALRSYQIIFQNIKRNVNEQLEEHLNEMKK
ncbi:lipoprotein N-acyltransferase Lnb domain-containing protein [Aureibacter tunicatorum]|uniref:DUF4105 domain-containing protein n=1 Tax=Aureibacter tunicatorum TaxID=866807 RepID=A0AAE4BSS6_9BACT|nr:DUF4105 domain-containing protein [Aureibacter tunicatorum]MDR6238737.1 hypothetical protein [Aureibacter tunicatorum]BDD05332.1 membrane protein [Aureibacter tunicatorum]